MSMIIHRVWISLVGFSDPSRVSRLFPPSPSPATSEDPFRRCQNIGIGIPLIRLTSATDDNCNCDRGSFSFTRPGNGRKRNAAEPLTEGDGKLSGAGGQRLRDDNPRADTGARNKCIRWKKAGKIRELPDPGSFLPRPLLRLLPAPPARGPDSFMIEKSCGARSECFMGV